MSADRIPVLLYHAVDDACDPRFAEWTVAPKLFDDHMAHLADCGYRAVTVRALERELRAGARIDPRTVVVTFDDGFADVHAAAWPALRRHGIAATVFVATGFVGETSGWLGASGEASRPMMTREQIAELADAGIECAAHGHRHLQLDAVGASVARRDVMLSRLTLTEIVGDVVSFAYPHGYYTRRLQRQVRDAGFHSACSVRDAMSGPGDDPFARARIVVRGGTTVEELERLLRGEGVPDAAPGRTLRRAAWRSARRAGAEPLVRHIRERANAPKVAA